MTINFDKALGIHEQALQVRSQRAQVLANNLANADTPGYKSRDIDFKGILQGQVDIAKSGTPMKVTNNKHMAGQGLSSDMNTLYRIPQQPSLDGNTVEEQIEHAAFMKNNLDFQASFTLLNRKFTGLLKAIKGE
jgi:flagellar basal-body rod protein FlgB